MGRADPGSGSRIHQGRQQPQLLQVHAEVKVTGPQSAVSKVHQNVPGREAELLVPGILPRKHLLLSSQLASSLSVKRWCCCWHRPSLYTAIGGHFCKTRSAAAESKKSLEAAAVFPSAAMRARELNEGSAESSFLSSVVRLHEQNASYAELKFLGAAIFPSVAMRVHEQTASSVELRCLGAAIFPSVAMRVHNWNASSVQLKFLGAVFFLSAAMHLHEHSA